MVTLSAREAADALEEACETGSRRCITQIRVTLQGAAHARRHSDEDNDGSGSEQHGPSQQIRRFVTALENHKSIRVITFADCTFRLGNISSAGGGDDDEATKKNPSQRRRRSEEDTNPAITRLFGSVLPSHRTLDTITFSHCEGINATDLQGMLSSSDPSSSVARPRSVSFYDTQFNDPKTAQAISSALQSNASLKELHLIRCGFDSEECCLILDGAASRNCHLQSLSIVEPDRLVVDADTLHDLLGGRGCGHDGTSNLKTLRVSARKWTPQGVSELVRRLRTNDVLESLDVSSSSVAAKGPRNPHGDNVTLTQDAFRELLTTYNCTLRYLSFGSDNGGRTGPHHLIDRLLDRNVRIMGDYYRLLQDGVPFYVRGTSPDPLLKRRLWSESINRLSAFPTLIYRFLKRSGYGAALAEDGLRRRRRECSRNLKRKVSDSGTESDEEAMVRRPVRRCRSLVHRK